MFIACEFILEKYILESEKPNKKTSDQLRTNSLKQCSKRFKKKKKEKKGEKADQPYTSAKSRTSEESTLNKFTCIREAYKIQIREH